MALRYHFRRARAIKGGRNVHRRQLLPTSRRARSSKTSMKSGVLGVARGLLSLVR
jgi:hypothetical protein